MSRGLSAAAARSTAAAQPRRGGLSTTTSAAPSSPQLGRDVADDEAHAHGVIQLRRRLRVGDGARVLLDADDLGRAARQRQRDAAHAGVGVDHALGAGERRRLGDVGVDARGHVAVDLEERRRRQPQLRPAPTRSVELRLAGEQRAPRRRRARCRASG